MPHPLVTKTLSDVPDDIAPDGSEIRLLPRPQRNDASLAHCTLPAGGVSKAVAHRTVEEIWYVLSGEGEVWRAWKTHEEVVPVGAGMSLNIPLGTRFQFRTVGSEPLTFLLTTIPPWPGPDEAVRVKDHWPVS
jgi:mannose-6-phosphate isomerase-like protein (cupin superfamily)